MKRFAAIIIVGCLLTLAVPAYAGSWQVSGYAGNVYVSTRGVGGGGVYFSNGGKLIRPGGGPHHEPWQHPGGYGPGWPGGWYTVYPYGWAGYPWDPPVYYRTPVYVVTPRVTSGVVVISGSGAGYEAIVEESPVIRTPDVYAVPAGVPAAGPGGDTPASTAWTSPDRPRRNLDGILRVFQLGGIDRAETDLGRLVRSNPSDAQLSYVYGYVLFLREKYATASFVLRRALMLDGELAAASRQTLEGFYDAPRSSEGLARLNRYVEANPGDASARLVRAYVLFLGDRKDAAREDLAVVLRADGSDPEGALLLRLCTPGDKTGP